VMCCITSTNHQSNEVNLSNEVEKSVMIWKLTIDFEWKCHFLSHFFITQNCFQSDMINQLSNYVSAKSLNLQLTQQTNQQDSRHHKSHKNWFRKLMQDY
jgi:ribonucleotide reductase beta subunit family protein with ferritin-like domain